MEGTEQGLCLGAEKKFHRRSHFQLCFKKWAVTSSIRFFLEGAIYVHVSIIKVTESLGEGLCQVFVKMGRDS